MTTGILMSLVLTLLNGIFAMSEIAVGSRRLLIPAITERH